jgi:hypothetical protein
MANEIVGGSFFKIEVEPLQAMLKGEKFVTVIQFKSKLLNETNSQMSSST